MGFQANSANVVINLNDDSFDQQVYDSYPLLDNQVISSTKISSGNDQQKSSGGYQYNQNMNYAPPMNYYQPSYQQPTVIKKEQPKYKFVDYYNKTIENDLIKRTEVVGNLNEVSTAFDDFFEKHTEKFFTPEIHEMIFFYSPGYIHGLQFIYRDPWGKMDKETYKGNIQLPRSINPKECQQSKITFDYDEFPKEIYVDGQEYIQYIKIVSSKNKKIEIGKEVKTGDLENQVKDLTRILGVGGSHTTVLNSIYFYYL